MSTPFIPSPLGRFYTAKEAARYLRVSEDYLERLRMSGEGPNYIKLGQAHNSKILYHEHDLHEWILLHRRCGGKQPRDS